MIILDPVTGQLVDTDTGEVVDTHPIVQQKPRAFSHEEYVEKTHSSPITFGIHDFGLHSTVSDRRLGKLNESIRVDRNAKEKKLVTMLSRVWNIVHALRLPSVVGETASIIVRRYAKAKKYISSAAVELIPVAAVYTAAKIHKIPLTPQDLGVNVEDLRRTAKKLIDLGCVVGTTHLSATHYIPRIVQRLGLSTNVEKVAAIIARRANVAAKPYTLAAAAIYISVAIHGESATLEELGEAVGTNCANISRAVKKILSQLIVEVYV